MTIRDNLNKLASSFVEKLTERAKRKQALHEIDKLIHIFNQPLTKPAISNIIGNIMLSQRERIHIDKNCISEIKFETVAGFGCQFDLETELEILDTVDRCTEKHISKVFVEELKVQRKKLVESRKK